MSTRKLKMILFAILISLTPILAIPTSERIIGGYDIPIEDVPYQVSLQADGEHNCGGSIIAPKFIVTAAHCFVYSADGVSWTVRAGTSTRESGGQVVDVQEIYIHPTYLETYIDADIAIAKLADDLEYNDKVAPIALPTPSQSWANGTELLVSGWGILDFMEPVAPVNLQMLIIQFYDRSTCNTLYGGSADLPEHIFCAGVDGNTKSPCYGDSGGPLQADGVLVGVVNGGAGCNQGIYPGYYAQVSTLLDFIQDVTGL